MKTKRRIIDNQVITYLVIIIVIVGLVVYASRRVLFRPWTARTHMSAVSDGPFVYTIGGLDRHNVPLKEVLLIDLEERKIQRIADLPTPRYATAAVLHNGTVYVAGGYDNKQYYTDILALDRKKNRFSKIGELPEPRCYGGLAYFEGSIYYIGGWNGKDIAGEIIEYEIVTGRTGEITALTEPLQFQTVLQEGDRLYIYGGEKETLEYNDVFYTINLENFSVEDRCRLPAGLVRSPAEVSGNSVYIAGGWSSGPFQKLLNVQTGSMPPQCRVIGEIPYNSEDMALASYNGSLFLIGGREERFQRQIRIVRIDPETLHNESLLFKSFAWW